MDWLDLGQFQSAVDSGSENESDFLVETPSEMLICEVKAANDIAYPIVGVKATDARTKISAADEAPKDTARKSWRYALIPHDSVTEAATLAGLMGTYGQGT
jgi:type III restriction enzyme